VTCDGLTPGSALKHRVRMGVNPGQVYWIREHPALAFRARIWHSPPPVTPRRTVP